MRGVLKLKTGHLRQRGQRCSRLSSLDTCPNCPRTPSAVTRIVPSVEDWLPKWLFPHESAIGTGLAVLWGPRHRSQPATLGDAYEHLLVQTQCLRCLSRHERPVDGQRPISVCVAGTPAFVRDLFCSRDCHAPMARLVWRFDHGVPNRRRVNLRSSPPLEKYAAWAEFQRTFDTKISFALYLSASSFSALSRYSCSRLCYAERHSK